MYMCVSLCGFVWVAVSACRTEEGIDALQRSPRLLLATQQRAELRAYGK